MLELNLDNITEYVSTQLSHLPFTGTLISTKEVTEETYVNWIFHLLFQTPTGNQSIYLRQSRNFVKTKPDFAFPAERIQFEDKILRYLETLIPDVIPHVIHFDKENCVLWLSDIKRGAPLLVNELIAGRAHSDAGPYFGHVLGRVHGLTRGITHEQVRGSAALNHLAVDFHLGMRLKPARERYPAATATLLANSNQASQALVLGDLASKNIFVDGTMIRFLDLERAFVGDPAFDLAFLFCHLLIEVPRSALRHSLTFIDTLLRAYEKEMIQYISDVEMKKLSNRILRFTGVTILYRLHGFYLVRQVEMDKTEWERVAEQLLHDQVSTDLTAVLKTYYAYSF